MSVMFDDKELAQLCLSYDEACAELERKLQGPLTGLRALELACDFIDKAIVGKILGNMVDPVGIKPTAPILQGSAAPQCETHLMVPGVRFERTSSVLQTDV